MSRMPNKNKETHPRTLSVLFRAVTVSGGKVAQFLFYTFEGTVFGKFSDVQTEIKSVSIFIKKSEKLPQKKSVWSAGFARAKNPEANWNVPVKENPFPRWKKCVSFAFRIKVKKIS